MSLDEPQGALDPARVQGAGGRTRQGGQGGGGARRLSGSQADAADAVAGVGPVGAGDAAPRREDALQACGQQAAVGNVVGNGGLGAALGLPAAGGVVDVNEESGFPDHRVLLPGPGLHVPVGDDIVPRDPPGLPDP